MPTGRTRFVLLGLAVVLVASVARTVWVEREQHRLARAHAEAQQMLQQIEQERLQLTTELGDARETISEQTGQMGGLQHQLQELEAQLEETVTDLASLQQEHEQLRQQHASLSSQFDSVAAEKQQLEARLSSLKELKLAIRDVRRQIWAKRFAAWRAYVEANRAAQQAEDQAQLASGNHGFVVRSGTSTLGSATRMHVHVLEPESK